MLNRDAMLFVLSAPSIRGMLMEREREGKQSYHRTDNKKDLHGPPPDLAPLGGSDCAITCADCIPARPADDRSVTMTACANDSSRD